VSKVLRSVILVQSLDMMRMTMDFYVLIESAYLARTC